MEFEVIQPKNEVAEAPQNYREIATKWLESTGNLQKFTEEEKAQFIDICCAYGLNPIKKEVYGIKYGNNFNLVVGYEVYLKRAQRSGLLNGFNTTVESVGDDIKAVCTIYRKDWEHPFVHEVFLSEYHQHNKMWNEKPITMIKKVAEAQAFRKCFPEDLGGIPYTDEEVPVHKEELKPAEDANPKLTEIGYILKNSFTSTGTPVFTKEEVESYKQRIKEIGVSKTLEEVKSIVNERTNGGN